MISFVLPTRDRDLELARTIARLGAIEPTFDAEVLVVDNRSASPVCVPGRLANGWRACTLRLPRNAGAAGRNEGARLASGRWIVMLDDDSAPLDGGLAEALAQAPADVAAIGAEILLPSGAHESGGLPEVIVGCGAAVRREAFLEVGGYDECFQFYAEEYDLCAKLLLHGHRVVHDRRFRVLHQKTLTGRSMDLVLARLVRNNGWVMRRYAPDDQLDAVLDETVRRYRAIAEKESAMAGFENGLAELERTLSSQRRTPMSTPMWERFTGQAAVRSALGRRRAAIAGRRIGVVARGKGDRLIELVVEDLGGALSPAEAADALVIGTLSPGPLVDALGALAGESRAVLAPWDVSSEAAEPESVGLPVQSTLRRAG